ncbi:MAG: hypothetical protein AABX72_03435 [Nanoarchaeota archaeon]
MKGGEIEIQQIIYFIIGIVVLVALIYIFRSQITQFLDTLSRIGGAKNAVPPLDTVVGG